VRNETGLGTLERKRKQETGIVQNRTTSGKGKEKYSLRSTFFPSAHHSPRTVKRNAQPKRTRTRISLSSLAPHPYSAYSPSFHAFLSCPTFPPLVRSDPPSCAPPPFPLLSLLLFPTKQNEKNSLFVIGTVRLNSAFPISKKNHTLPVTLIKKGIAYAGRRSVSVTPNQAFSMSREIGERFGRESAGWEVEGGAVSAAPVGGGGVSGWVVGACVEWRGAE